METAKELAVQGGVTDNGTTLSANGWVITLGANGALTSNQPSCV
jgi:hypothetical protein